MTFEETKRLLESLGLRTVLLQSEHSAACLLVCPDLSARVMAVSLEGTRGRNFGFVSPEAIKNRGKDPQFNAYGGALRWWVGPEGGQFGVAFPPGAQKFDLDTWRISEEYNGKPFVVAYPQRETGTSSLLGSEFTVRNASGTGFHIGVTCRISLVEAPLSARGNRTRRGIRHLGYLSEMTFENLFSEPMKKETGLVSIWMLGMYTADPRTYVIAPFRREGKGKIVTDTYFSPSGVSRDRLDVNEKRGYLTFKADAAERSKIGFSRSRAAATLASIDLSGRLLTVWRFPVRRREPYVNSLWEYQQHPYAGDVSNSYNDDGNFGNFYELECSSHALALRPRERFTFPLEIHHFSGPIEELSRLGDRLLNRKVDWSKL